jgi:glucose dehydrogenase
MRFRAFAGAVLITTVLGCTDRNRGDDAAPARAAASRTRVADTTAIASGSGAEWSQVAGDDANTRYSPLDAINRTNAAQLTLAWSFSTGVNRGQEAAPLVIDGTMYVVTPYPNILYALDLTQPGAPTRWTYRPEPLSAAQGVACCDVVNRGPAYAEGRIFYNTLDAHTVAVDAETGREIWRTKLGDINKGETMTMAPFVVKGKVLVGVSGGEFGVRGWLTALDAASGAIAWRAYHTGPDADVLIGERFKPFPPA